MIDEDIVAISSDKTILSWLLMAISGGSPLPNQKLARQPRITRSLAILALAKQAQIARWRSSRSPFQAGMMVSGVMLASWQSLMSRSGAGSGGLAGMVRPVAVGRPDHPCHPARSGGL